MNLYSFTEHEGSDKVEYFGTLADAQAEGKKLEEVWRVNARIHLWDIASDKYGVLRLLNCGGPHKQRLDEGAHIEPLRTWSVTSRGGVKEITA